MATRSAPFALAANTEFQLFLLSGGTFKGAFGRLGKGFTADYSKQSESPAFVGAVYESSKAKRGRLLRGVTRVGVSAVGARSAYCSQAGTTARDLQHPR